VIVSDPVESRTARRVLRVYVLMPVVLFVLAATVFVLTVSSSSLAGWDFLAGLGLAGWAWVRIRRSIRFRRHMIPSSDSFPAIIVADQSGAVVRRLLALRYLALIAPYGDAAPHIKLYLLFGQSTRSLSRAEEVRVRGPEGGRGPLVLVNPVDDTPVLGYGRRFDAEQPSWIAVAWLTCRKTARAMLLHPLGWIRALPGAPRVLARSLAAAAWGLARALVAAITLLGRGAIAVARGLAAVLIAVSTLLARTPRAILTAANAIGRATVAATRWLARALVAAITWLGRGVIAGARGLARTLVATVTLVARTVIRTPRAVVTAANAIGRAAVAATRWLARALVAAITWLGRGVIAGARGLARTLVATVTLVARTTARAARGAAHVVVSTPRALLRGAHAVATAALATARGIGAAAAAGIALLARAPTLARASVAALGRAARTLGHLPADLIVVARRAGATAGRLVHELRRPRVWLIYAGVPLAALIVAALGIGLDSSSGRASTGAGKAIVVVAWLLAIFAVTWLLVRFERYRIYRTYRLGAIDKTAARVMWVTPGQGVGRWLRSGRLALELPGGDDGPALLVSLLGGQRLPRLLTGEQVSVTIKPGQAHGPVAIDHGGTSNLIGFGRLFGPYKLAAPEVVTQTRRMLRRDLIVYGSLSKNLMGRHRAFSRILSRGGHRCSASVVGSTRPRWYERLNERDSVWLRLESSTDPQYVRMRLLGRQDGTSLSAGEGVSIYGSPDGRGSIIAVGSQRRTTLLGVGERWRVSERGEGS
jgi:hypothetical protein